MKYKERSIITKYIMPAIRKKLEGEVDFYHLYKIPDCGRVTTQRPYDLFAVAVGQFIAFEVKIKGAPLSEHQKINLAEVEAAGGEAFVIRFYAPEKITISAFDAVEEEGEPESFWGFEEKCFFI